MIESSAAAIVASAALAVDELAIDRSASDEVVLVVVDDKDASPSVWESNESILPTS